MSHNKNRLTGQVNTIEYFATVAPLKGWDLLSSKKVVLDAEKMCKHMDNVHKSQIVMAS